MPLTLSYDLPDGTVAALDLDAVVRDAHESDAEITDHPVERGSNISDHVRQEPFTLEIEGVVSNQPITGPRNFADGASGTIESRELPNSAGSVSTLGFSDALNRSQNIWGELLRLQEEAILINVSTSLRDYEDLVLQRVAVRREAGSGDSLPFTARLRQVRIVDSEVVDAPEPEEPRGRPRRRRGSQQAEEQESDPGSFLSNTGIFGNGLRVP